MERFVKIYEEMTFEQTELVSKKKGGLFFYVFMRRHVAPGACLLTFFDNDLRTEFLEKSGLSETELTIIIRYLRAKGILKAVRKLEDDTVAYAINPFGPEDMLEQALFNQWKDGCFIYNYKLFLELTSKTKEKRSNKGEKQGEEESNKSYHEEEEPKVDSKEIVYEEVSSGIAVDDEPERKVVEKLGTSAGGRTVYKVGNKAKEKILCQFDSIFNE